MKKKIEREGFKPALVAHRIEKGRGGKRVLKIHTVYVKGKETRVLVAKYNNFKNGGAV